MKSKRLIGKVGKTIVGGILATGLANYVSGCATISEDMSHKENPGLRQEYKAINPNNLTEEQKENAKKYEIEILELNDLELATHLNWLNQNFPWINPKELSERDKAYLWNVGEEMADCLAYTSW